MIFKSELQSPDHLDDWEAEQYKGHEAGSLFTKLTEVLPIYLVSKPRDSSLDFSNRSEIYWHLGSKFQSDTVIVTSYLVASRLHEIWRYDDYNRLVKTCRGPEFWPFQLPDA